MMSYGSVRGRIHRNVQQDYEPEQGRKGRQGRKVRVEVDGDLVFGSIKAAASAIGCASSGLDRALRVGCKCKGHKVRRA